MIHLQEAGCAVANLLKGRLQQKSAVRVFQFQDLHAGMSSAPSVGEDWGDHGVQPCKFSVHFMEV